MGRANQEENTRARRKRLERRNERTFKTTYIYKLKHKLEREKYLEIRNRYGAPELTKIRGGSNRLRVETGRWTKIPERFCELCLENKVEDETHFMLFCPVYNNLRDQMWKEIEPKLQVPGRDSITQRDKYIEHPRYTEIVKIVMKFIEKAMKERKMRQGVKSEQHGYSAPSL